MPDFYTVVTDTGLQALGLASTQGQSFSLTQAVVGDGNGFAVVPNKGMTSLVNEVWRGNIAGFEVDPKDPNTRIFEFAIPADTGGFTIREVGLLDENGKLFCIGNFPDTEKPVAADGSVRDLVVRLPLHFENADVVNLVIDPAMVLATKEDLVNHNADPQAHRFATTAQTGFVRLATDAEHVAHQHKTVAATPWGVWKLLESVMSNACASTSTIKIATSNAVCQVFNRIEAHKTTTDPHNAQARVDSKMQGHLNANDPHGVVAKVKALLSSSVTSTSTTTFATPKAVKTVNDSLNAHKSATDPHNAQACVDSKMQGHLNVNDPHGAVAKVKALLNSSVTSTSTTTFATPKAVKTVNDSLNAHKAANDPHGIIPDGGESGQVLIKQADGGIEWGTVAGVPVGELCFSTNGVALPGTIPVNVKQKVLCSAFPQLFEWMKGGTYLTNEAAWDAEAAAQDGTCGKYCWDGGEHFILPCYTRYFAAAYGTKAVGDWDGDAIRNITGEMRRAFRGTGAATTFSGAVTGADFGDRESSGVGDAEYTGFIFDASKVVPTAEENRPKTSYVLPCIKAFDVPINAAHVDMLALAQQVAAINGNKADRTEVPAVAVVSGAIGESQNIPLPSGYTEGQCRFFWAVGLVQLNTSDDYGRNGTTRYIPTFTNSNTRFSTGHYIVVGVK